MTSNKKNILIIIIAFVIIILLAVVSMILGRIPLNEDSVTGNTAGNLNNGGYFCEADGRVYFANAYDYGTLYSMNPDESDMKKLGDNTVSSINAGGNYLYYAMTSSDRGSGLGFMRQTAGIYRSNLKGKKTVCLERCHIISMQLCGSYLFYEKYDNTAGPSLEKIRIDKKEQQTVSNEIISPNCYANGQIYYHGMDKDHYLHTLNPSTGKTSTLWQNNVWNPIYQNGYVYYMDISNNYRLCRYSMSEDVIEVLTNERLDMFNVYGDYIYYQVSSETNPALKRMLVNGNNQEIVREGVYQNINITSEYVYFNGFQESTPVYKTSAYGPVNVTTFDAAMQAAMEHIKE